MSALSNLKGVLALMGRAPMTDFSDYFGEEKPAFQNSLAAIGGAVLLILVIARNVIALQRSAASNPDGNIDSGAPLLHIGLTAFIYLLAFTLLAFMLSLIFERREAFWRWASLRHWMVFCALVPMAIMMALAGAGIIPARLAHIILFAVFISWLFADIRLAYKAGEMGLISAIFTACMVHAMGLSIVLTATVQMIN